MAAMKITGLGVSYREMGATNVDHRGLCGQMMCLPLIPV